MSKLKRVFDHPAIGGILLLVAALLALLAANSPWQAGYHHLLEMELGASLGSASIQKSLILWVNDGLMVLFFFFIGLELKRELIAGELSSPSKVALPAVGALGGMLVPALIYTAFNYHNAHDLHGWAIPTATDIAFALGLLTLLGNRVPPGLKAFLVSLAIFDDMGAILIIAFFYTTSLSAPALLLAGICLVLLFALNHLKVTRALPYVLIGLVLWGAVLQSGIHATIAGVLLAAFIPFHTDPGEASLLHRMEHALAGPVTFVVLPVFAFANAGLTFEGLHLSILTDAVPLGIMLGLIIGKTLGVFAACWVMVKARFAQLPNHTDWKQMFATSMICGIGFTMSLFIASLAFAAAGGHGEVEPGPKLGILLGSTVAAIGGYILLRLFLPAFGAEQKKS
jgi:NhaA family Na+:H+ antiporter